MISFAVENFNINKLIRKTPRYKLKLILLKSRIFSNILKLISYSMININHLDKFFDYFIFARLLNKSTITLNLSLSYYYKGLSILNNRSSTLEVKKAVSGLSNSVSLLGLPISFKTNNFIFFYNIYFKLSQYMAFYRLYELKEHYFYSQKLLRTYNNRNYYYSKVYEH